MSIDEPELTSLSNPRVKQVVKLRRRPARDKAGLLLVEGFRELSRALSNGWRAQSLFYCPSLFLGTNEAGLVTKALEAGAECFSCTEPVFRKIAYRDRPEGLLAVGPQVHHGLTAVPVDASPLLVAADAIEKPGNLGTILRSADAAGVHGVLVCDRRTDVNNPNVVRASLGALFTLPVVEVPSEEAIAWLREHGIRIAAATPHADLSYTEADFSGPTCFAVGAEQYGLGDVWMEGADVQVRIPMLGQSDSLNVATATTILLYEAVRQRTLKDP